MLEMLLFIFYSFCWGDLHQPKALKATWLELQGWNIEFRKGVCLLPEVLWFLWKQDIIFFKISFS